MARQDPLAEYNAKRDFARTPEPRAEIADAAAHGLRFFIQRHAATRLHYDFRLEWGGTLKSWAVPKGPSLDPDAKRLAVQTEDHPLSYGNFEGTIPAGEYGAGDVLLWDRGVWIPRDDPERGLKRGKLHFELVGEKLRGEWVLFRLAREDRQWMLKKIDDGHARPGDDAGILATRPESVRFGVPDPDPSQTTKARRSGKTVDLTTAASAKSAKTVAAANAKTAKTAKTAKIAKAAKAAKTAKTAKTAKPAKAAAGLDATATRAAQPRGKAKEPLPDFIAPQLATLVSRAPPDAGWAYEVKYDGYRMLARCVDGDVRLVSRNGNDWTRRLAPLAAAMARLKLGECWLDGEIVVADEHGKTSFQALQRALDGKATGVVLYVFDLLHADGRDLRALPLRERVAELRARLSRVPAGSAVRLSEQIEGSGPQAWKAACDLGLEGLIGKRLDAPYVSGRSDTWIKLKCRPGQEFVIGGYTEPAGQRSGFGALLVGTRTPDGGLEYAGRVGTGFDEATLASLRRKLDALEIDAPAFRVPPRLSRATRAHWVRPSLVAQVEFAEWTDEGLLRQASFQGLREDKDPRSAQRERPKAGNQVGSVVVSNPDRVIYTSPRITKLEVVRYYEAIGPRMLPHVAGRPLSLVRCPQGIEGQCFFQKHVGTRLAPGVERVPIREKDGVEDYLTVTSVDGLIGLAQFGNIEFHTWGSHAPAVDRVDQIIFDLDPDTDLGWPRVVEAAQLTRGLLNELGLPTFLKTTGGKGVHVVVPVKPTRDWDQVKRFAQAVATQLARVAPDRFTAQLAKNRRGGRIFIDYLRNGRGATAIAAYSLRARPGAPVSMPIAWDRLSARRDIRGDVFNLRNAVAEGDTAEAAWRDFDRQRTAMTAKMFTALGVKL
jgi:bifunctional non-homologous end joining protein LigD